MEGLSFCMFIYFLHIVGALSMGFYLLLPFMVCTTNNSTSVFQIGMMNGIRVFNRYSQAGLILQLITGVYLLTKGKYSHLWVGVVTILFLCVAALAGMMGRPIRLIIEGIDNDLDVKVLQKKLCMYSIFLCLLLLLTVYFMVHPQLFYK